MDWMMEIERKLRDDCSSLSFSFNGYIYNPLEYAWDVHCRYQELAVQPGCHVLFLGMNPGPFGMMQTGIPFGCIPLCQDYLGLDGTVIRPEREHPRRPVLGFECKREEVSGRRFWSLIRSLYPDKKDFFSFATVQNFCPLVFIDKGETGRNITPDKLVKSERLVLEAVCMEALTGILDTLSIDIAVGVGAYATGCLMKTGRDMKIVTIPHPSPANPASQHGWDSKCISILKEEGVI